MGERARLSYSPHYTTTIRRKMATKNAGLQKELNVSDELAKIIGTKKGEKISRPQCTKRLWAYLKEKDLRSPRSLAPRKERKSRVLSAPSVCGPTSRRRISRIPRTSSGSPPTTPWHPSSEQRRSSVSACPST